MMYVPTAHFLAARARRVNWADRDPWMVSDRSFAAANESVFVKMIWGERRGHGTMGAVQRLPMELTHVATFSF
jgi:hypothetical protein